MLEFLDYVIYQHSSETISFLGALTGVGGVYLSYLTFRRDEPSLQLSLYLGDIFLPTGNTYIKSLEQMFNISITNIGRRKVTTKYLGGSAFPSFLNRFLMALPIINEKVPQIMFHDRRLMDLVEENSYIGRVYDEGGGLNLNIPVRDSEGRVTDFGETDWRGIRSLYVTDTMGKRYYLSHWTLIKFKRSMRKNGFKA